MLKQEVEYIIVSVGYDENNSDVHFVTFFLFQGCHLGVTIHARQAAFRPKMPSLSGIDGLITIS